MGAFPVRAINTFQRPLPLRLTTYLGQQKLNVTTSLTTFPPPFEHIPWTTEAPNITTSLREEENFL
jgi:hypothetical protein